MKFLIRIIFISILFSLFIFFYMVLNDEDKIEGASFNEFQLPDFNLPDLYESNNYLKEDFKGQFLINVWASWCITCRVEHAFLEKLSSQGVPIIGLNYKDRREDAILWISNYGDPYFAIIHDYRGSLALDMGVTGAPETFLVSDGKIIAHYQGEVNDYVWRNVFLSKIDVNEFFGGSK